MHAKRPFRMSCTWDSPSSVSTSNVLVVLLRLRLRWEYLMVYFLDETSIKYFLTLIFHVVTTDWPREHRLRNGAWCNTKLPGRETDWGGGEENPAGERRRGTQQPHEGQCVNISLWYVTELSPGIKNVQLTGFPNPLSGVGEPYKGFQDGDGGFGEPPGAEGVEPEAGSGGLRGNDWPVQSDWEEREGKGTRRGWARDKVSEQSSNRYYIGIELITRILTDLIWDFNLSPCLNKLSCVYSSYNQFILPIKTECTFVSQRDVGACPCEKTERLWLWFRERRGAQQLAVKHVQHRQTNWHPHNRQNHRDTGTSDHSHMAKYLSWFVWA